MKKIRYLLSVFVVFCLTFINSVSAVDITYVGTYVDPTGAGRKSDTSNGSYADVYLGFSVRMYSRRVTFNDWRDTYTYLDDMSTNAWKPIGEGSNTERIIRGADNESEDLDGTLGSYNTREVNFTGLVEKESTNSTYTTKYLQNREETKDYAFGNEDGMYKAVYDTLGGSARDISVRLPDGKTTTTVHVSSDVVTADKLKSYASLPFKTNEIYVDTSQKSSDQLGLERLPYLVNFKLKKSVATQEGSGYKLYKTQIPNKLSHNNIEILTSSGLKTIVDKYKSVYGMTETEVLKSLNDYGVRFSRGIASEAYGNMAGGSYEAYITTVGLSFATSSVSGSPATFKTGSTAIYALQNGSGYEFGNTGYGTGYNTILDPNGPYSNPEYNRYMDKSSPITGVSVLNNYDNIIRIPLAQNALTNIYIQYNRRDYSESAGTYTEPIRTPEWGEKENTIVKNLVDQSQLKYAEKDEYIHYTGENDTKGFDERFAFDSTVKTNDNNIQFSMQQKLSLDVNGKSVSYALNLDECRYVININITKAIEKLNNSRLEVTNPLQVNLKANQVLLLKLVYDQVNVDNKILVQYRLMKYNKSKKGYDAPQRTYKNLETTIVIDNKSGRTVQRAGSVTTANGANSVFDEMFNVDMSEYNMAFHNGLFLDGKNYILDLDNSYFVYNTDLRNVVEYVKNNRITEKLSNPRLYRFTKIKEYVGIIVTYKEVNDEVDKNYIVLSDMNLTGTLQFINVTNTGDKDFSRGDTLASNVSNSGGTITSQGRNDSIANISEAELLNRFKFVRSTFTEGTTNDVTVNGRMGTVSYDFVPSGEYVSPYATGAYSYIVRAMTWKINERTFDIVKKIEARRSFVYVVRWAFEGPLPGFTHNAVKREMFLYASNNVALATGKSIDGYNTNSGAKINLSTKNTFIKYWEMNREDDPKFNGAEYYACPYATGEKSAYGDHQHDYTCCKLNKEEEYYPGTTIEVTMTCGGIISDTFTKTTYQSKPKTDDKGNEIKDSSGKVIFETVEVSSESTTIERKYGKAASNPYKSSGTSGEGKTWTVASSSSNACTATHTYSYTIGNKSDPVVRLSSINGYHSTDYVQQGACIDKNYHPATCIATLSLINPSRDGVCENHSKCGGLFTSGVSKILTISAKNSDDYGVSCGWKEFYKKAKDEGRKRYNNGISDEDESRTDLYVGHFHDEKCFITSYENKYRFLVDTLLWNDEHYVPKIRLKDDGTLPEGKESGIGNKDLVTAGMKQSEFEKYFEGKFSSMPTVGAISRRNYAKSDRAYVGSYTLKYYTIENFKMYKIKDMVIYDKADNSLGSEIFDGNEIVVPTSNNYENLFNENNSNGLYSNANSYESPSFLAVNWGISENFKKWGQGNSNEFSLDVPWDLSFKSKASTYGTGSVYLAKDSINYSSALVIGGQGYIDNLKLINPVGPGGSGGSIEYDEYDEYKNSVNNTSGNQTNSNVPSTSNGKFEIIIDENGEYKIYGYGYGPGITGYTPGIGPIAVGESGKLPGIGTISGSSEVEGNFTYGQIKQGADFTHYDDGKTRIYAYIGANGRNGGEYKDNFTNYRPFEDPYVFLADDIGYEEAGLLEHVCQLSVDALTDTEVALRVGLKYSIGNFYNDYFRFTKNYGENIEYLSHHKNYGNDVTLLNMNNNWQDRTDYTYTWEKGMEVTGFGQVKNTSTLLSQKAFLTWGARADKGETSKADKKQNELKKLFDASNFRNQEYAKKFANGNDTVRNGNGVTVRGYSGTYITGEGTQSGSSYEYTKNYIKFTDNAQNTKVTDVYDWTLMNLPTSVLYSGENGVGNGRRTFEYTIRYELVTAKSSGSNGILYKDSDNEDSYTNYTNKGTTYWKKPDFSKYTWTSKELDATGYTDPDISKVAGGRYFIEPDATSKHEVEVADHIHDENFTQNPGEQGSIPEINANSQNRVVSSMRFSNQSAYLNILSPVKLKSFWLETADLINHITTTNDIKNVLGKNTKFTLHWDLDTSTADVGYGIGNAGVDTEKYTKEFWLVCDFDLWCFGCKDHASNGYHPALSVIKVANGARSFDGRTTGTYSDPAVGKGENFIKIFAIANNTPTTLEQYVVENDINYGQYLYEDENYNTFVGRQTGRMNQIKGADRTSLYTDNNSTTRLTIDDAFHISYKEFTSDSIFRIFGFEITDFTDILYKPVFRNGTQALKDNYYTGRFEWIYEIVKYGQLISGDALNTSSYMLDRYNNNLTKLLTLPVGPYSNLNTGYPYAPKLGYTFSFNVKTTGYVPTANENNTRKVKITPSYYFISKDGKTYDSNIDLYYKNAQGIYTKFENSGYNIAFKPNDGYRNLRFIDDTDYSSNLLSSDLVYLDISNTNGFELDNKCMTTSYTNFIQTWYGEFKLPNSTIAVRKNGNLNSPYKDGYIGVKFDIVCTDTESGQTASYLQNDSDRYKGKDEPGNDLSKNNTTEWDYEGNFGFDSKGKANRDIKFEYALEKGTWNINGSLWNEIKSTVVLYDTDLRAEADFE